jgi:hypothetical protein
MIIPSRTCTLTGILFTLVMLQTCFHTTQLLLHRQFMQSPTVGLDNAMTALISHSHSICSQAATSIIELAGQTKLQDFLTVSPITSIYAVFQGALISLYNVGQGSTTNQAMTNLKRGMEFLMERKNLTVVSRVIEILKLLTALNKITDKSILPETELDESLGLSSEAQESSTSHAKQKRPTRTPTTSGPRSKSTQHATTKHEEMDEDTAKQTFASTSIPTYLPFTGDPENEMPKAHWMQRMMYTSVVGGISPEIQASMKSVLVPDRTGMTLGHQPGLHGPEFTSDIASNLNGPQIQPPMVMRPPDQTLVPWNHLQMLPQNYYHYPMNSESFGNTEGQSSKSVPEAIYESPFHGIVPSQSAVHSNGKSEIDPNMVGLPQTMSQDQTPLLPTMMQQQQQRQDMHVMPPGSLNWEEWDSYVDQEINRA